MEVRPIHDLVHVLTKRRWAIPRFATGSSVPTAQTFLDENIQRHRRGLRAESAAQLPIAWGILPHKRASGKKLQLWRFATPEIYDFEAQCYPLAGKLAGKPEG